jgi:hypothetical protein
MIGFNTKQLIVVSIINCQSMFEYDLFSNVNRLMKLHLEGRTSNMASLVIEQASLTQLTMIGVTHHQPDVESQMHEIHEDLSKLDSLQILALLDCQN